MAGDANNTGAQELRSVEKRINWLDDERRKYTRRLAELEQKSQLQEKEIASREERIRDLERSVSNLTSKLTRLSQVDAQLQLFKEDFASMIADSEQRREQATAEAEKLRRIEHETLTRELADVRKEMQPIKRLERAMEARSAEEARLAQLIGVQDGKRDALDKRVEEYERNATYLEEKERQNSRAVADVQARIQELTKKTEPVLGRLDILADSDVKLTKRQDTLVAAQAEADGAVKSWSQQIQIGEHERNQRLQAWQLHLDEHEATIERFNKEWLTFRDQYKEAKAAVQTLAVWQQGQEKSQREATEVLRVETNRLNTRWDSFREEIEKQRRNFELDTEQRLATFDRRYKELQTAIANLDEALEELKRDRALVWQVQKAQANAIKKLPNIWAEEVEKAMTQDPNRRRQPALVPVREE